jgi:hypothetical protein
MLARRLTTILPAMSLAEALETTRIHSVAGLTGARTALVTTRPHRAPHHTFSAVGLDQWGAGADVGPRAAGALQQVRPGCAPRVPAARPRGTLPATEDAVTRIQFPAHHRLVVLAALVGRISPAPAVHPAPRTH